MKVPVLFVTLLAIFAASNLVLHESGLLTVTIMGMWISNAKLPSYSEFLRFKEHATVLLVSGVFILLAASLDFTTLAKLDWRCGVFGGCDFIGAAPDCAWRITGHGHRVARTLALGAQRSARRRSGRGCGIVWCSAR